MSEERRKILDMLAAGKIKADEAERLLDALSVAPGAEAGEKSTTGRKSTSGRKPKYLHIQVNGDPEKHNGREQTHVKIPLILLRAGMKLKGLVPKDAQAKVTSHLTDHGLDIDLEHLDSESLNALTEALAETAIDIDSNNEKVRIFCA